MEHNNNKARPSSTNHDLYHVGFDVIVQIT